MRPNPFRPPVPFSFGSRRRFSPTQVPGLVQWLKADGTLSQTSGGSAAVADADPVGLWAASAGTDASQATAASRGTLRLNVQNGLPVVRTDGVDDHYLLTGLTHASGPRTIFWAGNPGDLSAATLKYVFDTQTGRLVVAAASNLVGKVGWQDSSGSWRQPSGSPNTAAGFQVLTWDLQAGTGEMFRNGTSLGTATYTSTAIGGRTVLSADSNGPPSSIFLAADHGEFLIYSALTNAQRDQVITYLRGRWGV